MTKLNKNETSLEVSDKSLSEEKPIVNLDGWLANRTEFKDKIVNKMVDGKHYHKLNFKGKEVQVLSKGGAEMVASAFGWTAEFIKDTDTWEMLGSKSGVVCYICNLKNGQFVGQGRGVRQISQDNGDLNKTVKMAQKSAHIDAILRSSGLSDLFTQDLEQEEDMPREQIGETPKAYTTKTQATAKQKAFIQKLCNEKGITGNQLKELVITYNSPSALIEHLLTLTNKQELPVVSVETPVENVEKANEIDVSKIPF